MLRNDGKIFECSSAHPYILYNKNDILRINLIDLFLNNSWVIDWFYKNTNQIWVKNKIKECLQYLIDAFANEIAPEIDLYYNFGITKDDLVPYINKYNLVERSFTGVIDKNYVNTCSALLNDLNDKCNQEFLRFRTSGMYYGGSGNGIYFRISSIDFNWFNLIWEIVYKNKDYISDVTIVADEQSGKKPKFYNLNGPVNKMPVKNFIWLKGNPIVETLNNSVDVDILNQGGSLVEIFGDYGPFHNHRKFKARMHNYLIEAFIDD